jgi:CRISPR-associated protein Csd1
MSILASLAKAYERLDDAPSFGFSTENIGFLISLNDDATSAGLPIDLRDVSGKRPAPRRLSVPASFKRPGVTPKPFFLWDNTAFALGVSANPEKDCASRWLAFRNFHSEVLQETADQGLVTLRSFLEKWSPYDFEKLGWPADMKDQNVVFALESERRTMMIHERPAAKALWAKLSAEGDKSEVTCLVTGERAPVARLHPSIKGVWGAQSSGASIVSFNLDAFGSYGRKQGENAPVSVAAAFAYTTALNKFLEAGSKNRIQIGDTSTVFWADASDAAVAEEAEGVFAALFTDIDEMAQAQKIGVVLENIRRGRPLKEIAPELEKGVRFYILGLAPNASRLSIRFWLENDFGTVAKNYQRFVEDMRIEPPPRDGFPALWKYLVETAVLGKRENVPPNLAGEWMRSILTGTPYPLTLLSTLLMRLRADTNVNALRVSTLKALLIRNYKWEVPVALDAGNTDKGYLLGRLFALYEFLQAAALGSNVNATIKDKYYGSASAQPRKVFSLLERGSANHLSKLGKQSPGRKVNLEKQIGEIMGLMQPSADPFPATMSAAEQALFGLGYYHERNELFRSKKDDPTPSKEIAV